MPRYPPTISCKYLRYKLPESGTYIRLPLLHVRLISSDISLTTIGLVDSGATVTFVPTELAEILKLTEEGSQSVTGAGGKFEAYRTTISRLEILKRKKVFASFREVPVLVPRNPGAVPYVILGRDYIFPRFRITFIEKKQRMVFRRSRS